MKYQRFGNDYVVRIDRGEEILAQLRKLAETENIRLASFTGLGACDRVKVSVYNVEEQKYYPNEYNEAMELTALIGNFTTMNGAHYLHVHATFGQEDGASIGGHLNEAWVCGTAEIFVHTLTDAQGNPASIDRFRDTEDTGLNLLDLG